MYICGVGNDSHYSVIFIYYIKNYPIPKSFSAHFMTSRLLGIEAELYIK